MPTATPSPLLTTIAALLLAFTVAACGDDGAPGDSGTGTSSSTETSTTVQTTPTSSQTSETSHTSTTSQTSDEPDSGDDADVSIEDEPDADPPQDVSPDTPEDTSTEDEPPPAPDVEDDTTAPDVEEDTPPDLDLRILNVIPDRGPVQGGTILQIEVNGNLVDPVVYIGSRRSTQVEVLSPTTMTAETPAGVVGTADVKVFDGQYVDILPNAFRYFEPLSIESVSPSRVSTRGGEIVEVRGSALHEGLQVSFGGRSAVRVDVIDDTTLFVVAPTHPAGQVDVRATDEDSTAVLEGALTYYTRLSVQGLFPAVGPQAGGNVVSLFGDGLTQDTRVLFGDLEAENVTFVNPQRMDVVVPPGPLGAVDVQILTPSSGVQGLPGGYTYLSEAPTELSITSVAPNRGSLNGGDDVFISGFGFDQDELRVMFGDRDATLVEITDHALHVRTPPGVSSGVVSVTVSHALGSATRPGAYTYLDALLVESVTPNTGPTEGGTEITVQGEGFDESTRFWVGPLEAADVTVVDGSLVRLITPPGSLGWSAVRAVEPGQNSSIVEGFLYTSSVEIASFEPARGSVAGGTVLTIRGRGFYGTPTVTLDGDPCVNVRVLDQASLTCMTPAHREGTAEVVVALENQTLVASERYTYFNPASRFGGAWGDAIDGAVNVSVFSIGGAPIEDAFVMLSVDANTPYQGTTDANGLVTFSGDGVLGEQFVTATAPGHSSATVQAVDAQNITLLLYPSSPPSGGGGGSLPLATITGLVSGWQKIVEPGPFERQMIIVETTRESPWRSNPWPGSGNVVLADGGESRYTMTSRVGDLAVVAFGGIINDQTGVFTPYLMGIQRFVTAFQDDTLEIDIELDIPLNNPLTFKINGAQSSPDGPNVNRVTPWVDLGFEGVFNTGNVAEGTGDIIVASQQPALVENALAGSRFYVYGGSFTGSGTPYSVAVIPDLTETDGLIEMPSLIGIPQPLVPQAGGLIEDGSVAFAPLNNNRPDFWRIQIFQLPSTLVWEVVIPGDQTWFQLPEFPDFSDLPPEEQPTPYAFFGELYMIISGARIDGFDFDQHEYLNDLRRRDRWTSWTRQAYVLYLNP